MDDVLAARQQRYYHLIHYCSDSHLLLHLTTSAEGTAPAVSGLRQRLPITELLRSSFNCFFWFYNSTTDDMEILLRGTCGNGSPPASRACMQITTATSPRITASIHSRRTHSLTHSLTHTHTHARTRARTHARTPPTLSSTAVCP